MLGEQQGANLQAAALGAAGLGSAPAHDPGQGAVGQGDGELGGVAADPCVLLPAAPAGTWVTEAGPLERLACCRVGVEPAEQVQVGFLDRAQPDSMVGHGAIIARAGWQGEPAVE